MNEQQDNAAAGRKVLKATRLGQVVSAKADKTRKVAVSRRVRVPKYGKYITRQTTMQVHDPDNVSVVGDQVEIAPCRPISKTKSWRLLRVVKRSQAIEVGGESDAT